MRSIRALLLLASFPVLGVSVFGAGTAVTSIAYGPSPFSHFGPEVASNGSGFVTVWPTLPGQQFQLFASSADESGHTLSRSARLLAQDRRISSLQILSVGNNYVITWLSDTPYPMQRAIEITSALEEVRAFTFPASGRVAWNGREFAIARGNYLLLTDRSGQAIRNVSLSEQASDVIAAGDDFVAISRDDRVVLQRVTGDGVPVSRTVLVPPATGSDGLRPSATSVASNGSDLAVIWVMTKGGGSSDLLRSAIVRRDGVVRGRSSLALAGRVMKTSLVRHREQYYAVAIQPSLSGMVNGIFASFTIDFQGALVRNESSAVPTDASSTDVVSNGQILYAAGRENLTRDPRDPTSNVSPSFSRILGGPLEGARWTTDVLSIIPRRQARPQLASLGVDFLGAWLDQILGDEGVMAGSISRGGTASQETREIDTKNEGLHYDVAAGSTGYLLVWTQDSGLYARRFLPNGLAVDAERMVIRAAGVASRSEISAVWNGTRFFIAWAEGGEIVGAFLDPDGAVSPPQNLTTGNIASAPSRANPHLAWNGREFLLVWDAFSYCPGVCGVGLQPSHAARLSADGRRLDATSLVLSNRMSGQRVASNGRDFLVTSEEEGGAIARLVRSDGNGIAADPPIRLADYWALTDVARAGDGFVVAVRYGDRAMASWIGTVHIAAGGDVTSRMYVESGSGGIFERPAIAVNATGDVLIVESDVPPAVGSQRLRSYLESEMRPLPAIPAPPIVTSATIVPDGIRVSWRQPSGVVSGYVIEARRPGTSYFFPVALAPAEATSFFIAQYGADTVRIRAWNVAGLSEPSAEIGMTSPLRGRAIRH